MYLEVLHCIWVHICDLSRYFFRFLSPAAFWWMSGGQGQGGVPCANTQSAAATAATCGFRINLPKQEKAPGTAQTFVT